MVSCLKWLSHCLLRNIYVYLLWFIILLHLSTCLILDAIHKKQKDQNKVSSAEYILMIFLLVIEWSLCIYQTRLLLKYILLADIKPIICLYISKIIACSTIYLLIFKADKSQFVYPLDLLNHSKTTYLELTLTFFNYSASEQTCTGVSDVVPTGIAAEIVSGAQILVFGIAYNVFILSVAILRFSEGSMMIIMIKKHDENSQGLLTFGSSNYDFFQINEPRTASSDILNIDKYPIGQKHMKKFEFFYDYMLFIVFGIQLINALIVYFICDTSDECHEWILIISIILDLILLFGCLICVCIKLKMIKVIGMNINSSFIRLIYAYLTILCLFTILYFDLWLLTKRDKIKPAFKTKYDEKKYWKMMEHFFYFSITSFTEHGSESIILTWSGYAQFLNAFQMLIGVFFLSVVFGIGLMNMDIYRTIATEQYIAEQLSVETQPTPALFKAGLLTKRVSRLLHHAKRQQCVDLAASTPRSQFGDK